MHLRLLTNFPLRRLDALLRPALQRLAAQQSHLLDYALFRRVRFLQGPSVTFHRTRHRRNPASKSGVLQQF